MSALPPLTPTTALDSWALHPLTAAVCAVLLLDYLGMVLLRRAAGRRWPLRRTLCWCLGVALLVVATQGSLAVYEQALFWWHMVTHLVLIMVVPVLLLLGAPLTLVCEAFGPERGEALRRALGGRAVGALTHPAVGLAAYTAAIVGTHLTGFMNAMMSQTWLSTAEALLYVVVGFIFFLPLVGDEPIRWRLSPALRIVVVMLAMPVDTFTGVVLGQTEHYPWPAMAAMHPAWAPSLLADLHGGGAVMWIGGDAIMAVLLVASFIAWATARQPGGAELGGWLADARLAHQQRLTGVAVAADAGEGADTGDSDAHLAAYNAYLARLAGAEARRPGG